MLHNINVSIINEVFGWSSCKKFYTGKFLHITVTTSFYTKKTFIFRELYKNNYKMFKFIIKIRVFIQNINIIYLINMLSYKYDR